MSRHGHNPAQSASAESVAAGYELADVGSGRPIVLFVIAIFGLLFFAFGFMAFFMTALGSQPIDTGHAVDVNSPQAPPEPRIEANPNIDGERIVREATERLETYGWVNRREGIVHIPIERAKELLLEKGVRPFEE